MNRSIRTEIMGDEEKMTVQGVEVIPTDHPYQDVTISTSRGPVICRYYPAKDAVKATVMVGGIGGNFDSPADSLYPKLAEDMVLNGISSLRVQYRHPFDLNESTLDVIAALSFLHQMNFSVVGLVGHSLGGAAVIQAAVHDPTVRAVVALSPQSYGTEAVASLQDGVAVLFIHGREDQVLPTRCSTAAYAMAKEPKELIIHDHTGHSLEEAAGEVYNEVRTWLIGNLK